MTCITDEDIAEYIQANIDAFHPKRLESLLRQIIKKTAPTQKSLSAHEQASSYGISL